jgi:hypothetical protein
MAALRPINYKLRLLSSRESFPPPPFAVFCASRKPRTCNRARTKVINSIRQFRFGHLIAGSGKSLNTRRFLPGAMMTRDGVCKASFEFVGGELGNCLIS